MWRSHHTLTRLARCVGTNSALENLDPTSIIFAQASNSTRCYLNDVSTNHTVKVYALCTLRRGLEPHSNP